MGRKSVEMALVQWRNNMGLTVTWAAAIEKEMEVTCYSCHHNMSIIPCAL